MTLRIGIAGYGRRGRWHVASLEKESNATLSAISDPSEIARKAARDTHRDYDVSVFDSAAEMADSGEVDAVIVAAPAHLNGKVAKTVIQRSIPVLIEKPPGLSLAEVSELKEVAVKQNCKVMVAFNRRFNPLVQTAIKEIRKQGKIHQIVAEFHKDIHDFTDAPRYSPSIMDYMLLESPIHSIDLITHIANCKFVNVESIVKRSATAYRDVHAALIEFENGIVCQFTAAYTAGGRLERYEIHGEFISAYLEGVKQGWILEPGNQRREIDSPAGAMADTEAQDSHFVNCILNDSNFSPPAADLDSSIETLRLCEAILAGTR